MKRVLLLLVIISALSACRQEEPIDTTTNTTPIINLPTGTVDGSINGLITNDDGPLAGVAVQIMGQTIDTDSEGLFAFNNIELDKEGTLLTAVHASHFDGSRVFYPSEAYDNYVHIKLHTPIIEDFQSDNGGLVIIEDATVLLPSGNYKSDIDTYSGVIKTKGLWLDPTEADFSQSMPGDLRGISESDELVSLIPYGMIKLSLENGIGTSLDLPEGSVAELKMPIPTSMLDDATQTTDLYYYNDENGVWIQEGTAEKQDGFYYADVNHFTYWVTAESFQIVEVKGIVEVDGSVASNKIIYLTDESQSFRISTVTTSAGRFTLRVPSGLELTLSTVGQCNGQMVEEYLGVINDNENVNPTLLSTLGEETIITGSIKPCVNLVTSNAFARIVYDDKNLLIKVDDNGDFQVKLPALDCSVNEVTIYAIDIDNSKISESITREVSSEINVDVIFPCDEVASGYRIDYKGMDWQDELNNSAEHDWGISTIASVDTTIIISPTIKNIHDTSEVFMSGAFVFQKGAMLVDYLLDFPTQGFKASGTFAVQPLDHDSFTSYRFSGISNNITKTDDNLFPTGLEEVEINLVYYD